MTGHAFSGRRVLVTGGTGFIGSRLCSRLQAVGAEVYATFRTSSPTAAEVEWLAADLADLAEVNRAFSAARPEVVFHLASHVSGGRGVEFVHSTFYDNLVSTVNLLTVAQARDCPRIVLAGSMEEPAPEVSRGAPSSPYAAAKWAASAYARMFHALYSLPVVTLRIFMVYGPGQRDRTKLVPYVIRSLLQNERPRLTSGTRSIDWIYVDDVVEAFLLAAQAQGIEGAAFDIGSGTTVTIRELVERITESVNPEIEPIFGDLPDRPLETSNVADVRRTTEALGWRPTTTLADGLRLTADWLAQQIDIELSRGSA